jgi:AmiR/NasT family two-component response regulator
MQQAGFDGYMFKPLNPHQIMPYLEKVAGLS